MSDRQETFYIKNKDDDLLDTVTDDMWLSQQKFGEEMRHQFKAIRSLQDRYWDMRKVTNHGSIVGGDGGMKHVASIPKNVAFAAELLEPELFKNEKIFYAWLERNPQYKTKRHN